MNSAVEYVQKYIDKCELYLIQDGKEETIAERKKLIKEIVSVFGSDINHIGSGLTLFPRVSSENDITSKTQFTEDVSKLKAKLELYKCKLEQDASNQQAPLINNYFSPNNVVNVSVSVYQTMEIIDDIEMDADVSEEIKSYLLEIDSLKKKGDKAKLKEKICTVVKYVADKSVDALIAVLPYLSSVTH